MGRSCPLKQNPRRDIRSPERTDDNRAAQGERHWCGGGRGDRIPLGTHWDPRPQTPPRGTEDIKAPQEARVTTARRGLGFGPGPHPCSNLAWRSPGSSSPRFPPPPAKTKPQDAGTAPHEPALGAARDSSQPRGGVPTSPGGTHVTVPPRARHEGAHQDWRLQMARKPFSWWDEAQLLSAPGSFPAYKRPPRGGSRSPIRPLTPTLKARPPPGTRRGPGGPAPVSRRHRHRTLRPQKKERVPFAVSICLLFK